MRLLAPVSVLRWEAPADRREARAAVAVAAGLYFVGAALCATAVLLPHVGSPAGVIAVALTALSTGCLLSVCAARGWGGLGLAFVADLWGTLLIAVLCASGGGAYSPFALIYLFPIGHAAAFQPRARFVLVAVVGLLAFLAPLVYEQHVSATFGVVASVGIVISLLASLVVHSTLNRVREQRRRLQILTAASSQLDRSLDPGETLRTIAHMAVPELAELCVIDLLDPSGSIASTVAAASDPDVAAGVERMRERFPVDMRSDHPVSRILAGLERRAILDLSEEAVLQRVAQSDEHARFMREVGYARAAVFPMVARGRTHGVISFLALHSDARYDHNLVAVLEDLAGRAALAYDNARLYAERAQVARTLRRSLMPAVLPQLDRIELASYFRPTGAGNEMGGDFYDVFEDGDGCWLVVGDVCGKGAEAAAVTGFLRHTAAAYAREGSSPGEVLAQVNRAMLDRDFDGRFATAILARIRAGEDGVRATVALAGHPSALIVRAGARSVGELGASGTLLGVFADPGFEEVDAVLQPGDSLALYTDGLSEAYAPARVVSVADMVAQLQRVPPTSAQGAIDTLIALIDPDDRVRDDIAVLCARVRSDPRLNALNARPAGSNAGA